MPTRTVDDKRRRSTQRHWLNQLRQTLSLSLNSAAFSLLLVLAQLILCLSPTFGLLLLVFLLLFC